MLASEVVRLPEQYIPHKPTDKQIAFLLLEQDEAFYGGAAGGGKSDALLMAALQYVDIPGYAALLLRKTYADLSLPGAIMNRSHEWLDATDASWHEAQKTWTFPSGATLTFGYVQKPTDVFRYQSSEFQYIGWDELTQFPEYPYRWMFSRLRRREGLPVPLRTRSASNPGNVGHEWVKRDFVDPDTRGERIFIPALLEDNPHLDYDTYVASLARLDPITRMQYLMGDWTARHGAGKFRREWFETVDAAPAGPNVRYCRFWDLAATEPKPGLDPDYTAGGRMCRDLETGWFYLMDMSRFRETSQEVERSIINIASQDGIDTMVRIEQEPGAAGKLLIGHYAARLAQYNFKGIPSTGSKEVRATPFSSQAEAGNVKIVRGDWNEEWFDEAEGFPFGTFDDQVDAFTGAYTELAKFGMVDLRERKAPALPKPQMAGLRKKQF